MDQVSILDLEQFTNAQVGAAAKALILTWLISADEVAAGEPVDKLELGVVDLLRSQAQQQDTEYDCHVCGFADNVDPMRHDADVPVTPEAVAATQAATVLALLVARVVEQLRGQVT